MDRAIPESGFGFGLNLHDGVDVARDDQAIDGLNVMFNRHGKVMQRDGYDNLNAVELTNQPACCSPYTSGSTRYLVVGHGRKLTQLNTSGTIGNEISGDAAATYYSFAEFGSPGTDALYCANGIDQIIELSGTTWSTLNSTPDYEMTAGGTDVGPIPKYLATWQNRLVAAENSASTGFTTALNKKDTIRFSNAAAPYLWTDNDYVHLTPGDGEPIMGCIAWRELLFVFKQTKFFVFYGVSTDSSGNPVFNYRTVENNIGLASARALCAGRDGVYFMDRKGVYRTTGADPTYVSENVEPIFSGDTTPFFHGGTLLTSQITNSAMSWTNERVYLAYTSTGTTNDYMLVYDTRYGWWTLYNIPASCLCTFRPGNNDELLFGYSAGTNSMGRHEGAGWDAGNYTNDDGTAITSRWQSGWYDYGSPNVKSIRATRVNAEGKFQLGIAHDYATSPNIFTNLDFTVTQPLLDTMVLDTDRIGPLASYQDEHLRNALRGQNFSTMVQNSILDQGWTIHGLDNQVRGERAPGTSYTDAAA